METGDDEHNALWLYSPHYVEGEPAEKPRSQKYAARAKKRTGAVFCFSFATNKTRAVPFLRRSLSA